MKNPETGRSRGFGFVSFRDPSAVQLVLSGGPHFLDGRTVSRSMAGLPLIFCLDKDRSKVLQREGSTEGEARSEDDELSESLFGRPAIRC